MKLIKRLMAFSIVALATTACELPPPIEIGEQCPPSGAENAELAYIHSPFCTAFICEIDDYPDYSDSFAKSYCPLKYPHCYVSDDQFDNGPTRYFCDIEREFLSSCPFETDLRCDKKTGDGGLFECINPGDNRTCGANNCDAINYGGVDCSKVDPFSHCDSDTHTCVCRDDALFCNNEKCVSPSDPKTCGANDCNATNYGGVDCTQEGEGLICSLEEGGTYACKCPENQVFCNGKCIMPETDLHSCGAKGACSSDDPASSNFKGVDCGAGNGVCTDGECACSGGGSIWCIVDGTNGNQPKCHSRFDKETCNAKLSAEDKRFCTVSACPENTTCATKEGSSENYCKTTNCNSDESMCSDSTGNVTCIKKSDPKNCGNCNTDCSSRTYPKAKPLKCEADSSNNYRCSFTCDSGLTDCSNNKFEPNCVDKQTDPENCGSCGKKCNTGEACVAGVCKRTSCDGNVCQTDCKNTDSACGPGCDICANFGSGAKCNVALGKCGFSSCPKGTHPVYDGTLIRSCANNTATSCAPNTMTVGQTPVNCTTTKGPNVATAICNADGKCEASVCTSGNHLLADKSGCTANSNTLCASTTSWDAKSCNGPAPIVSGTCNSGGSCTVTTCQKGYHISSDGKSCQVNSDAACGKTNSSQVSACKTPLTCLSDGTCGCTGGLYPNWNATSCVPQYCQFIPGVTAGNNRTKSYYSSYFDDNACDATACASGYELKQQANVAAAKVCVPTKTPCSAAGYDNKTSACSGCCSHSKCESGYRWYIYACLPIESCCGTTTGDVNDGNNFVCRNCRAMGKTCNKSSGECN